MPSKRQRQRLIVERLFIAVPELSFNFDFVQAMVRRGLIDQEQLAATERAIRTGKRMSKASEKMKGDSLIRRLISVAPELFTVETVNLLATTGLIGKRDAHLLRLASRSLRSATRGGLPTDRTQLLRRLRRVGGVFVSNESIDLLRRMDWIGVKEANRLRATLLAGEVGAESIAKARQAKTLMDMLALAGSTAIDSRTIRALQQAGLITGRHANTITSAIALGQATWTNWEGAKRAQGLQQRMAYVLSGSFSWETMNFLKANNLITPTQERWLRPAIAASQAYNRELMERYTRRKMRVVSGEAPIKTFSRLSKETDARLLSLLAESANNADKTATRLAGGRPGEQVRAAQLRLVAREMHVAMREVWEGVGYLTIWGESRVAEGAVRSMDMLQRNLYRNLDPSQRRNIQRTAMAGLDSFISRRENTLALSRRVYKNMDLATGKIERRLEIGLLQGRSAAEIAEDLKFFISPKTPGGVSYAAMRLARTELSNAFQITSIRHTREMPWVRGYKWNLSASHPKPDVCDSYAEGNPDNMGVGIFSTTSVPGIPHPHCFCYVTPHTASEAAFIMNMNRGFYDRYLNSMAGANV